jgi:hypothetical protein
MRSVTIPTPNPVYIGAGEMQTAFRVRAISLGRESATDDRAHKRSHLSSIVETLLLPVLLWFQRHGLRPVLLEICNCYRRIQMGREMRWETSGLDLAQVLASLPTMTFPRSCSGNLAYSMCIRALERDRQYLTAADYELFAQAWFQAEKFFRGSVGTQSYVQGSDSNLTSSAVEMLDAPEQFGNAPDVVC